jgi:uncharacterized membrane protein
MPMLYIHLSFSLLAMILILTVFALPKGRFAHRVVGRGAAVALLMAALTTFAIRSHGHYSVLHLLSVATVLTVPYAIWMARRGHIARHKRIMLINAGGLFVAGLAATLAPGRTLHTLLFG